jgi:hypothetical protein
MASEDTTCTEAKALLTRYNINALLVGQIVPQPMVSPAILPDRS